MTGARRAGWWMLAAVVLVVAVFVGLLVGSVLALVVAQWAR